MGTISFLFLNFYKSLFFILKFSEVYFPSLNFAKHSTFFHSVYTCYFIYKNMDIWQTTIGTHKLKSKN